MTYKIKLLTLSFLLLCSQNLFAEKALPEFTAKYAIEKFGVKLAEAEYQLSYTETGYKFTQSTQLYGFASMFRDDSVSAMSYIDEVDGKLLLKKHDYKQTGKEKNKNEDISIHWDTQNNNTLGKITGVIHSKTINKKVTSPIWEALSFQIPLMIEANEKKKIYPYSAIIQGEINTYDFELKSKKAISFADEDYQTLEMVRVDTKKNRQLHLWLAPQLHNLPIVIENYRDGKEHSRMQLESVQFNNESTLSETEIYDDF